MLKEVEKASGTRTDLEPGTGTGTRFPTRKDAAEEAGLSKRQAVDAIRVANVERDSFEAQVEIIKATPRKSH